MHTAAPVALPNGKVRHRDAQPSAPPMRRRVPGLAIALVVSCLLLVALAAAASWSFATLEQLRAEHAVLVRDLAATTGERDELLATRDRLTAERDDLAAARDRLIAEHNALVSERDGIAADRDRLASERDGAITSLTAERDRVGRAEAALQETSARLTEAQDQLSKLRGEAQASATEVQRLREEIGRLRERADLSQADARETASARDRAKAIAQAALTYAEKGSALSTTRNRMIDVLKEVIAAERDGRSADARQWVDEYNELVPLHNRQVSEAHAALATLRGLL